MDKFYVYVYLDPRKPGKYKYGQYEFDYEPYYVGKGRDSRAYEHIRDGNLRIDGNKFKSNKIKKLKTLRYDLKQYVVFVYEKLTEKKSFTKEIEVIKKIGRRIGDGKILNRGPLVNLSDGGAGVCGFKKSKKSLLACAEKSLKFEKQIYLDVLRDYYEKTPTITELSIRYNLERISISNLISNKMLVFKKDKNIQSLHEKYKNQKRKIQKTVGIESGAQKRRKLSDEDIYEVFDLYLNQKSSMKEIGMLFNVSSGLIKLILRGGLDYVNRKFEKLVLKVIEKRSKTTAQRLRDDNLIKYLYLTKHLTIREIFKTTKITERIVARAINSLKTTKNKA